MNLPTELFQQILESLAPASEAILRPSHPVTKTWLALSRVCRATRPMAAELLQRHCVYIDSERRLRTLLDAISLRPLPSLEPPRWHIPAMYLAPFDPATDPFPVAQQLRTLLLAIRGSLRRLTVDLAVRVPRTDDPRGFLPTVHDALRRLDRLEECVSVSDGPALLDLWPAAGGSHAAAVREMRRAWPRLRVLALHGVDPSAAFWEEVARMPRLERLVLTRVARPPRRDAFVGYATSGVRPLRVILANVSADQWEGGLTEPVAGLDIRMYDVPMSFYGDEDPDALCRSWVTRRAIQGAIWSWEGERVPVKRAARTPTQD